MTELRMIAGLAAADVRELRTRIEGDVVLPGEPAWDEARLAWNLAVDQRPTAVVVARSARDVAEVMTFARESGLRVAPQGTGHGAVSLGDLHDTILLKLHELRGVTIDPAARTARAEAGTIWIEVVEAAAEHGLAALAGSSPDVGVVGYTLGGGLSWLARKHGIGANQVTAIEAVTADGELRRVDRDNDPDLFWALRGGGGNFAVVTAIEFNLFPLREVYAGILWFPVERAEEILTAWRRWTNTVPDELTSVGRILQFPPIEAIPEPVRGKSFVVVESIFLGDEVTGGIYLEPLRALKPVMDTVRTMPVQELSHLHMDPEQPVPGAGDGMMLNDVDAGAIAALVEKSVGAPFISVELRHLGGAVARASADHGALASFDAPYTVFAVGMAPNPHVKAAVEAAAHALLESLDAYRAPHTYMNFAETKRDSRSLFSETAYHRLRRVKAVYDPENVMRSNHELD